MGLDKVMQFRCDTEEKKGRSPMRLLWASFNTSRPVFLLVSRCRKVILWHNAEEEIIVVLRKDYGAYDDGWRHGPACMLLRSSQSLGDA